jgi:hypothetical protein
MAEKRIRIRIPKNDAEKKPDDRERIVDIPDGLKFADNPSHVEIPQPPGLPEPFNKHPHKKFYRYAEPKENGDERDDCHLVIYSREKKTPKDKTKLGKLSKGEIIVRCEDPNNKCANLKCKDRAVGEESGDLLISCNCMDTKQTGTKPDPAPGRPVLKKSTPKAGADE